MTPESPQRVAGAEKGSHDATVGTNQLTGRPKLGNTPHHETEPETSSLQITNLRMFPGQSYNPNTPPNTTLRNCGIVALGVTMHNPLYKSLERVYSLTHVP